MACDLRCDLDGITQANAGAFARKLAPNTRILRLRVTPSLSFRFGRGKRGHERELEATKEPQTEEIWR